MPVCSPPPPPPRGRPPAGGRRVGGALNPPPARLAPLADLPRRGEGEDSGRSAVPAPIRLLPVFVFLALVVPIFAHGCHGGDHDDEPAFAPPARRHEPPVTP
jgi:hypothetical protein